MITDAEMIGHLPGGDGVGLQLAQVGALGIERGDDIDVFEIGAVLTQATAHIAPDFARVCGFQQQRWIPVRGIRGVDKHRQPQCRHHCRHARSSHVMLSLVH